jgi:hypothetical protein
MTVSTYHAISANDAAILRGLGARVAEIAVDPVNVERRRLWTQLNALRGERPMVLTETGGVYPETMPDSKLVCEGEWARGLERGLRDKIFYFEEIGDDMVIEARVTYGHCVRHDGYGVSEEVHRGNDGAGHGSYVWEAPLQELPKDLDKLHMRRYSYDADLTAQIGDALRETFDGVLKVENRSGYWWTQGLTWTAIRLIGLEGYMMAMYDQPEGLHALMAFLRDDHLQVLDWFEANGLLTPNNEDDYIGSGGRGHTDLLPQPDWTPGTPCRVKDLWGLSESQETVSVSPAMFEEFVFPYQAPVISRFGFACYGCCEPVDQRWHIIRRLPNLRRVSISPWSDVAAMAANLGSNYVFSRKPNPAYISSSWEEDVIRRDLRDTLVHTQAHNCNVELVMKDVHTLQGEPDRLGRWTRIAREVIDEVYG